MLLVSSCTIFLRIWNFTFIHVHYLLKKKKNKTSKLTYNKQQAKNNHNNKAQLFLCFYVIVEKNYTRSMILQRIAHRSDTPRCCCYSPHGIYPSFGEADQESFISATTYYRLFWNKVSCYWVVCLDYKVGTMKWIVLIFPSTNQE